MFTQQAEQKIYSTVQIPPLRKNQTGTLTTDYEYLIYPTDFLYPLSLAIVDGDGDYNYLLNKDVNFMREAYPNPATTGEPKHYAIFDKTAFILGPTPDSNYEAEIHYGYYPESIVTASTTWLGDDFDSALLNGAFTIGSAVSLTSISLSNARSASSSGVKPRCCVVNTCTSNTVLPLACDPCITPPYF